MTMDIKDLKKFGMTDVEAKIYNELVVLGQSKIGSLIKRTGLHRGTVYNSLNSLMNKNFVVYSKEDNQTYYKLSDSNIFLDLVNIEKEDINKKELLAQKISNEIKNLNKKTLKKQGISIALGKKAYMEHFWNMFRVCNEKKIEYCWIGDGLGNTSSQLGEHNYRKILNIKKQMKIKFRSIMNIKSKPIKHKDYKPGDRYLPKYYSFPSYTWIYDNRVVIVIWRANPMIVITIEDEATAESYKSYFEAMYKIAKP
jgi:sugar-specific transcriptional regulator TrmB